MFQFLDVVGTNLLYHDFGNSLGLPGGCSFFGVCISQLGPATATGEAIWFLVSKGLVPQ